MTNDEKSRSLGSILNSLEDLKHKIGRLPEDEIFIHQAFRTIMITVLHTYNQLEYGENYIFETKAKTTNRTKLTSVKSDIDLINKAYDIEQNNPHLDFYEVNRLANEPAADWVSRYEKCFKKK